MAARSIFSCLLLLSQSQMLSAQPSTVSPKAKWNVDWTENRCVLTRAPLAGETAMFSLRIVAGGLAPELIVAADQPVKALKLDKDAAFTVKLGPGGFNTPAWGGNIAPSGAQVTMLALSGLNKQFVEQLSAANEFSLSQGKRLLLTIPMVGSARAMTVLAECRDEKLVELGFDPQALANLQTWPKPENIGKWISAALKGSGSVTFRVTAGADGRASNCRVVESTPTPAFGLRACRVIEAKARFTPALSATGEPVAAPYVETLRSFFFTNYVTININ